MLVIRKRGYDDFEACIVCQICEQTIDLRAAWVAFQPPSAAAPRSACVWLHKECSNGRARTLFGEARMTLWRAQDLLSQLLRQTEVVR